MVDSPDSHVYELNVELPVPEYRRPVQYLVGVEKEPPQVPPVTTLAYVAASVMLARLQVAPVAGLGRAAQAACALTELVVTKSYVVLRPR